MKKLKPYLKEHASGKEAIERTKQKNVIAVVVKTYCLDQLTSKQYYSYKTTWDGNNDSLYEDFPLSLGSNQSIEEIDANDF